MTVEIPEEFREQEKILNVEAERAQVPADAKRIMIAVPNMVDVNTGLVNKLFMFAMNQKFRVKFHLVSEVRHHDHCRNRIAEAFLGTDADYLLSIDADVYPHINILNLADLDKDIVAGNVFCWINNNLMPSIWKRAECEQCRCLKIFMEKGIVHDPSQYRISVTGVGDGANSSFMQRWNPFRQAYEPFANKSGLLPGVNCRCRGTGLDPFVYRVHPECIGQAGLMEVDSVGGAATMVARRVFEKMHLPWYQFLYKEIRELMLTEDHFFCWRAKLEGFKIWADPQMACSHYKRVDLLGVNNQMVRAFTIGVESVKGKGPVLNPPDPESSLIAMPSVRDVARVIREVKPNKLNIS